MKVNRTSLLLGALAVASAAVVPAGDAARRFTWTTPSAEAKTMLRELQTRIESFQFGPANVELAQKIVAADPAFAMGHYYLAATQAGPAGQAAYEKAAELAKAASDGERRFIEAMGGVRNVQTANDPRIQQTIDKLEALATDYPEERLLQVILGQLYQGSSQPAKARAAFERCEKIGPSSPRVRSFLANDDLLGGEYAKARASFEAIERELPKGTAPFASATGSPSRICTREPRRGHSLAGGLPGGVPQRGAQPGIPEVFIWNSIARIHLEHGRYEAAMKAYDSGFESVPGSGLADDQKQLWQGASCTAARVSWRGSAGATRRGPRQPRSRR